CVQAAPHKAKHCPARSDDREAKHQLGRVHIANTQSQEQSPSIVRQRPVDIEEGIAIAKREVGHPARIPNAVADGAAKLKEEVDGSPRIMRTQEVPGREHRPEREHGQQRQQAERFHGPATNTWSLPLAVCRRCPSLERYSPASTRRPPGASAGIISRYTSR